MGKSSADPYRGCLSAVQISEGLVAAKRNAGRLLDDATILYDAGRFPSASSLATLSIEELGKLPILRRMALAESGDEWRTCWRDFASHTSKSAQWSVPFLIKQEHTPESFFDTFAVNRDPVLLNSLKQFGFYLGCYGRAHWAEPHKVIEKEQVEPVIYAARVLAAGSAPSGLDSPIAVQLWAEEMRGCFRCTPIVANDRIVAFLERARPEHVALDGQGVPPGVAFEFMSTVLYISSEDSNQVQ